MKKALLLLLLAISLPSMAQLQLSTAFDFGNPLSLNPPITPGDYHGAKVIVFDKVFQFGNVTISFSMGVSSGGSAQIMTTVNQYTGEIGYCLRVTQGAVMTISGINGATLNSIQFSDDSMKGDLSLQSGQPGSFSGMTWTSNGQSVSSVSFFNTGEASQLKVITVSYTDLQDVLIPSTSFADGATLPSFKNMTLTFADNITQVSSSGIKIEGTGITGSKALNVNVSGRVVTLSLPGTEELTTDGSFTITVPAGCFRNSAGYQNQELIYHFTVREPRNTLVATVTPEQGEVAALPDKIYMTFSKPVVLASTTLDLLINGDYYETLNINVSATDNKTVEIPMGAYTTYGTFKITVPEGKVHTTAYGTENEAVYDRWNPEFDIVYITTEPVDPLKELKEEAANLLSQIGNDIGYPAAGSNAEQLLTAVTAEGANPTEQQLNDAIAAFYAETNVVMPTVGTWYNIIGVNASNKKAYLAYGSNTVSLSLSEGDAAAFQVSKNSDGTYNFKTADGKYLMILSENGNVANEIGKSSKLTVAKLLVSGVDNEALLAKFSLYGWLGRDTNDNDLGYSTAAIAYNSGTVSVAPTPTTGLFFSETQSSAFIFVETSEPGQPGAIDPVMTLSPTSISGNTGTLTLIFSNVTSVGLKDGTKAFFSTDAAGQNHVTTATAESILTKTGANIFTVHLNGLAYGNYYLQLPVGTFDYTANDKPVNDIAKALAFSIVEPQSQFQTNYTIYNVLEVIERSNNFIDIIRDVDLNDLTIMAQVPRFYSDLIPDPSVVIKIKNYYTGDVIATGHFEAYANFAAEHPEFANDGYKAIKLVLPSPIQAGTLQYSPDLYCYDIPEATFGDAKFGQYLAGTAGVEKEDCIVNPRTSAPYFYVDNEHSTGIDGVQIEMDITKHGIFDLIGRRVTSPVKGNIYIINGKKVVIK